MPTDPNKTVFISYRRNPSISWARNIYNDLTNHGYDVFFDIKSVKNGEFDRLILNQIEARMHFILLLTPTSLDRCDDPEDWLRREIEHAMEHRRNIVPILEEGFNFNPLKPKLVGNLKALERLNMLPFHQYYFEAGMSMLRDEFLNPPKYPIELRPLSVPEQREAQRRIKAAVVVEPDPETAIEFYNWGNARSENSHLPSDFSEYSVVIPLHPDNAGDYKQRGRARRNSGDLPGAISDYTEAIRLNPHDVDAYNNRGNARKDDGDIPGAISDYNEAIRLNPSFALGYHGRGIIRMESGDLPGAISDFTEAIHLGPSFELAYNNRGLAHYNNGDLPAAISDFTNAINSNPRFALAYNNRGLARYKSDDLRGAMINYTEAIRIDPNYANAYLNRGILRETKKDFAEAISDWEQYVRLDGPLKTEVEKWIANLKKKLK